MSNIPSFSMKDMLEVPEAWTSFSNELDTISITYKFMKKFQSPLNKNPPKDGEEIIKEETTEDESDIEALHRIREQLEQKLWKHCYRIALIGRSLHHDKQVQINKREILNYKKKRNFLYY